MSADSFVDRHFPHLSHEELCNAILINIKKANDQNNRKSLVNDDCGNSIIVILLCSIDAFQKTKSKASSTSHSYHIAIHLRKKKTLQSIRSRRKQMTCWRLEVCHIFCGLNTTTKIRFNAMVKRVLLLFAHIFPIFVVVPFENIFFSFPLHVYWLHGYEQKSNARRYTARKWRDKKKMAHQMKADGKKTAKLNWNWFFFFAWAKFLRTQNTVTAK